MNMFALLIIIGEIPNFSNNPRTFDVYGTEPIATKGLIDIF